MALSSVTVWEVRTTGANTNGGGFVTGAAGTDWSQQNAAQYSVTDGVTAGTTTITSATAAFGTDVVGNIMYVQGGTGSVAAGWYQITVRNSATSVTVDRSTGLTAGTGVTLKIGGALLSPAIPVGLFVAGHTCYIKAGTYTISSTTAGIANGVVNQTVAGTIFGYNATRGDLPNKGSQPLLQASGISTATVVTTVNAADQVMQCLSVDGASLTAIKGFALGRGHYLNCHAVNCTNSGFTANSDTPTLVFCSASGCGTQAAFSGQTMCFGCEAYDNTVSGFAQTGGTVTRLVRCLAYRNTGATSDGFSMTGVSGQCFECTAYGNGRDGFRVGAQSESFIDCLAEGNGVTDAAGCGFRVSSASNLLLKCAGYNNAGGNVVTTSSSRLTNSGFITGTATFFVDAGSSDFALNTTAGGGAAVRGVTMPFPALTTVGYLDVGAVQHTDPAGASYLFIPVE